MIPSGDSTPFDSWHPLVPFVYCVSVLVMSMAVFQPVFIALSFAGALLSSIIVRGGSTTLRSLRWQLPLIALVAVLNPLFATMGTTELFTIGPFTMYAESLAYGICMGVMLTSMLLWFVTAAAILSSSKVMALFGNGVPVLSLMMSMIARLTPLYVRQGREIAAVDGACSSAGRRSSTTVSRAARRSTVLMSWSMEDGLETADAMRARGFEAPVKRSMYARYRFRARDAIALTVLGALIVLCAFLAVVAVSQYTFYPTMPSLRVWWGYVPYALLMLVPTLAYAGEALRWMR